LQQRRLGQPRKRFEPLATSEASGPTNVSVI